MASIIFESFWIFFTIILSVNIEKHYNFFFIYFISFSFDGIKE